MLTRLRRQLARAREALARERAAHARTRKRLAGVRLDRAQLRTLQRATARDFRLGLRKRKP